MAHNPWHDIAPEAYDQHMSHVNVMQTQALSAIMKEQFELLSPDARSGARAAILGVANGNGFEHVIPLAIGHIVGIDISRAFLNECAARFSQLAERLELCEMDLTIDAQGAADVLSECDLIIANLLIEHIHLDCFANIVRRIGRRGQIISCVIQVNPDGAIASASGVERVFDAVVERVEEVDEGALTARMASFGFSLRNRVVYPLKNGKLFVRLDYIAGSANLGGGGNEHSGRVR